MKKLLLVGTSAMMFGYGVLNICEALFPNNLEICGWIAGVAYCTAWDLIVRCISRKEEINKL